MALNLRRWSFRQLDRLLAHIPHTAPPLLRRVVSSCVAKKWANDFDIITKVFVKFGMSVDICDGFDEKNISCYF